MNNMNPHISHAQKSVTLVTSDELATGIETSTPDIAPGTQAFSNLRTRLAMVLQTSLEINRVIELFLENLQHAVAIDGIVYEREPTTQWKVGRMSPHSASYDLHNGEMELGALRFHRRRPFRENELEKIEHLLGVLACPLRNALMYQDAVAAAYQDPLTGLGSRRALETTLERDIGLALRHQYPVSVLVIDVDHFKKINDTFGHKAGDKVLREVARLMQSELRLTDPAFRYGGEEFVVILNKARSKGAMGLAERIRRRIAETTLEIGQNKIDVSVSIGIASVQIGDDMHSLFERADRALYQAKCAGRNRCSVAETPDVLQAS